MACWADLIIPGSFLKTDASDYGNAFWSRCQTIALPGFLEASGKC